ncbi:MAG: hypothetical protein ACE365_04550 [Gammaproteobacteria bacterium]
MFDRLYTYFFDELSPAVIQQKERLRLLLAQETKAEEDDSLDGVKRALLRFDIESLPSSYDVYLFLKRLADIFEEAHDLVHLQQELTELFAEREDVLLNTRDDYCYSPESPINQFCVLIAKAAFPKEDVYDVLLKETSQRNESGMWHECAGSAEGCEFCRVNDGLYFYEEIFSNAFSKLREGETHLDKIFIDFKHHALSVTVIDVLRWRAPSMQTFIEEAEKINDREIVGEMLITAALTRLATELSKGDAYTGTGEHTSAGEESYEWLGEFFNWWNALDHDTQKSIKSLGERTSHMHAEVTKLGSVIDILANARERGVLDTTYCVANLSSYIGIFLSQEPVKKSIEALQRKMSSSADDIPTWPMLPEVTDSLSLEARGDHLPFDSLSDFAQVRLKKRTLDLLVVKGKLTYSLLSELYLARNLHDDVWIGFSQFLMSMPDECMEDNKLLEIVKQLRLGKHPIYVAVLFRDSTLYNFARDFDYSFSSSVDETRNTVVYHALNAHDDDENLSILEWLLGVGADINQSYKSHMLLHMIIEKRFKNHSRVLVDQGAECKFLPPLESTVMLAATYEDWDLVFSLVDRYHVTVPVHDSIPMECIKKGNYLFALFEAFRLDAPADVIDRFFENDFLGSIDTWSEQDESMIVIFIELGLRFDQFEKIKPRIKTLKNPLSSEQTKDILHRAAYSDEFFVPTDRLEAFFDWTGFGYIDEFIKIMIDREECEVISRKLTKDSIPLADMLKDIARIAVKNNSMELANTCVEILGNESFGSMYQPVYRQIFWEAARYNNDTLLNFFREQEVVLKFVFEARLDMGLKLRMNPLLYLLKHNKKELLESFLDKNPMYLNYYILGEYLPGMPTLLIFAASQKEVSLEMVQFLKERQGVDLYVEFRGGTALEFAIVKGSYQKADVLIERNSWRYWRNFMYLGELALKKFNDSPQNRSEEELLNALLTWERMMKPFCEHHEDVQEVFDLVRKYCEQNLSNENEVCNDSFSDTESMTEGVLEEKEADYQEALEEKRSEEGADSLDYLCGQLMSKQSQLQEAHYTRYLARHTTFYGKFDSQLSKSIDLLSELKTLREQRALM